MKPQTATPFFFGYMGLNARRGGTDLARAASLIGAYSFSTGKVMAAPFQPMTVTITESESTSRM